MAGIYGGAGIGVGNTCDQAARNPEVTGWVQSLCYSRERLCSLAAELHGRLTPVLAMPPPETASQAKEQQAEAPLAAEIQLEVIRLNEIEVLLSSILRRLEI